ncbi:unnamed protein product [Rhodiola kirilowii]
MSDDKLEFKWGTKGGVGGKNKEVQFYRSFNYDGVEYELFDCVYLWKDNEAEPFIGKIIKIWQDKSKKVKILWFFKPSEILNFLEDVPTEVNELFLGSGEGSGLANVNPLEAIAGKCSVVCISKDERNPQPTEEELQGADYVFYRIFDVEKLVLSEKIPEKIASTDIKDIFNRRQGQQAGRVTTIGTHISLSNDIHVSQTENGDRVNSVKPSEDKSNAAQRVNTARTSHVQDKDDDDGLDRPCKKAKLDSFVNLPKEKDNSEQKLKVHADGSSSLKSVGGMKTNMPLNVGNDLVTKASKVDTHVAAGEIKGKSKIAKISNGMDAILPMKRNFDEGLQRISNGKTLKVSDQTLNKQNNPSSYINEVTRRPDADRSKWFKELPWEERMENAHRQGALVLLENLDPSYTSADIEDIIMHGLKESCAAKTVYRATNRSPFSGQAFAIFRTKEVAEKVVMKLEQECLMLSNGRPLIASFGNPCFPGKETLIGHFGIDKLTVQLSREKKDAVSTSHSSQPNSIEYEFAMEWCLLQERSKWAWRNLHKQQAEEVKKMMGELKTKLT